MLINQILLTHNLIIVGNNQYPQLQFGNQDYQQALSNQNQNQFNLVDPRINQNAGPQYTPSTYSDLGVGSFRDMDNPMGSSVLDGGNNQNMNTGANVGSDWNTGFLDSTDEFGNKSQGWGMPALNFGLGALNAYTGYKQLGIAEDQLAFSERAFEENLGQSKASINRNLSDRQSQRVAGAGSGKVQSVDSYMKEFGV
jgi:hypothetical protein